jgi:hypothetical protein
MRRVFFVLLGLIVAAIAAIGLGIYVYPVSPTLVWCLLFLCWACYRLRMRAVALFSDRSNRSKKNVPRD